jgi:hypothetical protein
MQRARRRRSPPSSLLSPPSSPPRPQRNHAEKALKAYQDHPDAWSRVDSILEKAQTQQTKFFALQVRGGGGRRRRAVAHGGQRRAPQAGAHGD